MNHDGRTAIAIPADYEPAPDCLHDRIILVTGASAGIGAAAAKAYAAHGATVILLGRDVGRLEEVYDAIESAGGPQPAAVPFDLAQEGEEPFIELANTIAGQFPRLDGVLLNAGVLGERKPLEQTTWRAWREVIDVNVHSQFLVTKALMPLLREGERPSLVFTTSGVGRVGRAFWGPTACRSSPRRR
jgi:NAD(P)-dependent dehydrogenase (short-subunit alcohol dehydrogenase family)